MKKGIVLLFSFLFLFGISSHAFAAENKDTEQALKLIEKTNANIDKEIDKTVEKANKLQNLYFHQILLVKGSDQIYSLRLEQTKLENQLLNTTDEQKAAELRASLESIDKKVAEVESKLSEQSSYFAKVTAQFNQDLNQLIADLDAKTKQMTAETIQKAAELGVTAACDWKLVKIAHKWIWIDPIAIVGS